MTNAARPEAPRRRPVRLVLLLVLAGLLVGGAVWALGNGLHENPAVAPGEPPPATTLSPEELAGIQLGVPRLWHAEAGARFAIEVSAPDLDRDLVIAQVLVTGLDGDGEPVASGSDTFYLAGGSTAWFVGELELADDVREGTQVAGLEVDLGARPTQLENPGLEVVSTTTDVSVRPAQVVAVVESAASEPASARVVVIVHGPDGEILTTAWQSTPDISSAAAEELTIELRELEVLLEGSTVETVVTRW